MRSFGYASALTSLLMMLLTTASPVGADVVTATSCSESSVRAALKSITAATTRVNIPAGTCRWSTAVMMLNIPAGSGGIAVVGAGSLTTTGGGDATVIIDDLADGNDALFAIYQGDTNKTILVRVAGLTFQTGRGAQKNQGYIKIDGSVVAQVRVDHNHFTSTNQTVALKVYGATGVFDHNITNGAIYVRTAGTGDVEWSQPTQLGTSNFFFMEDNIVTSGGMNDCDHGGRFVVRYNSVANVQTHPTGGAGRGRGCRAWEVYGNNFSGVGSLDTFNAFYLSSGTGVVWNNAAIAGYSNFITLHSMRKNNKTYPESATPNGWGYCGTAFNGVASNWDGNSDRSSGYACLDQPGRGQGDLLSGAFPNVMNTTTGCTSSAPCAWPRQALEPVYEWLNASPVATYSVYEPTVLVANRDYYVYAPSFSGETGVGSGLLASRPSVCTPNVAYWATDTKTLYQCTAANSWAVYYKPFTYPHPLVSGGVAAPTNLLVK